jgi:hypothetical protein
VYVRFVGKLSPTRPGEGNGYGHLVPYQSSSCFLSKKIVVEGNLETQKAEQFYIVRLTG